MSPRSFRDNINGIEDRRFDGSQFGVGKIANLLLEFASVERGDLVANGDAIMRLASHAFCQRHDGRSSPSLLRGCRARHHDHRLPIRCLVERVVRQHHDRPATALLRAGSWLQRGSPDVAASHHGSSQSVWSAADSKSRSRSNSLPA